MIKICGEDKMTALQVNNVIRNTIKHWKCIAPVIHEPQNQDDYDKLAHLLDIFLDIVGEDESHELIGLIDVISHMIARYDEHSEYQLEKISGISALKFLMVQHHIKQSDLIDIGSQGVISEILSGKRKLNISQIKKLSKKFHVTPDTFID